MSICECVCAYLDVKWMCFSFCWTLCVLFHVLTHPEAMPKDFHWFFIGAAGAITPLHIDPSLTHAWLTQIAGRKRFTLFAPWDIPELLSNETDRSLVKVGNTR